MFLWPINTFKLFHEMKSVCNVFIYIKKAKHVKEKKKDYH